MLSAKTQEDSNRFSCCCVQGMDYLEYMGIVHRDLAARNVLGKNVCIKTDSTMCFCQIILCRYLFFLHLLHIMFNGVINR